MYSLIIYILPNVLMDFVIYRPPLPNYVTEELTKLVKNCVSTSNPARIQYCAQEIVITRENLFSKIARASMNIPPKDVHNHVSILGSP